MRMMKKTVSGLLAISLAAPLLLMSLPDQLAAAATATLSKSDYYDKTLASILGTSTGLLSGYEYVHVINPDNSIDKTKPWIAMPDNAFTLFEGTLGGGGVTHEYQFETRFPADGIVLSDDDMITDFFYQHIIDEHGPDVTYMDIRNEFLDHELFSWGGTDFAMRQMRTHNLIPNSAGQLERGNSGYWISEPYIESETLGSTFPGMPASAVDFARMHTSMTGDLDNVDWGHFWVAMYAEAYFQTDARTAMEIAAGALPDNSWARQIYDRAVYLHGVDPTDWRWAVREIVEMQKPVFRVDMNTWADRYADINNAFGIVAILYGNNDYLETIKIASLAGYDGDCTAATVGGLMGIIKGMDGTPEEVLDRIYADGEGLIRQVYGWANIPADYPTDYKFTDLAALYQANAEKMIVKNGGTVGPTDYAIERQTVDVPDYLPLANAGFEEGTLADWNVWKAAGTETAFADDQYDSPGHTNASTGLYRGTAITTSDPNSGVKLWRTVTGLTGGKTYRVDGFLRTPKDREARLFATGFDGAGTYLYTSAVTGLGSTYTYVSEETENNWAHRWLYVTLPPGSTSIDIGLELPYTSASDKWGSIDDISVLEVPVYDPGTRYEAESATINLADARTGGGASGGGYVGGIDDPGAYVEFTVNASSTGEKLLRLHYANGGSAAFHKLYVDGVYVGKVQYPATGSWGQFSRNITEVYVPIAAGTHTIRLEKDLNYAELDALDVVHAKSIAGPVSYRSHDLPYIVNNGVYQLVNKLTGKALTAVATPSGADAEQRTNVGSTDQKWIVSAAGDDRYRINSLDMTKALDVSGGSSADGADVWPWAEHGGDNQKWELDYLGNGDFRLIAKHSGKVLEIAGGSMADTANVQQWTWNGGDHQIWKLLRLQDEQPLVSGAEYRLVARHSGKALDIQGGSALVQNPVSGSDTQKWRFHYLGSGWYWIESVDSSQALQLSGGGTAKGTPLALGAYADADKQKWKLSVQWDGRFKLINKHSGKVIDVAGGSLGNGAQVWTWDFYDYYGDNQDWKLERA